MFVLYPGGVDREIGYIGQANRLGKDCNMPAVLRVENLSKQFDGLWVLRDVSFALYAGEILGILGPNGAGKTTLIHSLLGLLSPTSGRIEILGLELSKHRSAILKRINFASNYVSLPLSLTVYENLKVYAYLYEVSDPDRQIKEVLRWFGLEALRNVPSRHLSSGQMMRLCLAKAVINAPEILLLDEPTAGLDLEAAQKTRKLLKELCRRKGLSVIYTSHNLAEMKEMSDRIIILHGGKILALGPEEELLKNYQVQDLEELYFRLISHEG